MVALLLLLTGCGWVQENIKYWPTCDKCGCTERQP